MAVEDVLHHRQRLPENFTSAERIRQLIHRLPNEFTLRDYLPTITALLTAMLQAMAMSSQIPVNVGQVMGIGFKLVQIRALPAPDVALLQSVGLEYQWNELRHSNCVRAKFVA